MSPQLCSKHVSRTEGPLEAGPGSDLLICEEDGSRRTGRTAMVHSRLPRTETMKKEGQRLSASSRCIIQAFPAYIHAVTEEKSHSRTPFETALLGKNRSDQDVQGPLNCTGARARAGAGVGGYRASGRVHGKLAQPWGRSLVLHRWRGATRAMHTHHAHLHPRQEEKFKVILNFMVSLRAPATLNSS